MKPQRGLPMPGDQFYQPTPADPAPVKTWSAHAVVAGSRYLGGVEARTAEGAIDAAYGLESAQVSLCPRCAEEIEDAQIQHVVVTSGDAQATDREAPDQRIEEVERVQLALRLLELVERFAAIIWARQETDTASVDLYPPMPGEGWEIADSSSLVFGPSVMGATLSDVVEKALEELDHE